MPNLIAKDKVVDFSDNTKIIKKSVKISDDFYAYYRLTQTERLYKNSNKKIFISNDRFFFSNEKDIKKLFEDKIDEIDVDIKNQYIIPMNEEKINSYRNKGYHKFFDEYSLHEISRPYKDDEYFDKILNGFYTYNDFYIVDTSDENIYTLDRKSILAQPIFFGYIEGHISNRYYDLEPLAEHLSKRSDVSAFDDENNKPIKKIKILDIPYYNKEDDNNKYISFNFTPTFEQMQTISKASHDFNIEFANSVLLLDILDIKQFYTYDPEIVSKMHI